MKDLKLTDLKENTIHGDFILPFSIYKGVMSNNFPSIPMHWHEEVEVILVLKGSCNYRVDLNSFNIKEGDILIVGPQKLHSLSIIENMEMTWSSFVFNINMLKSSSADGSVIQYIAPILNHKHEFPLLIDKSYDIYNELHTIIRDIISCYENKYLAYELELKSLLFKFFFILYRYKLVKKLKDKDTLALNTIDKIKIVLNYINEHYTEDISINTLSKLCDYSEYHFMRFFKKHTGLTCVQYINNYRLEKAAILLSSSTIPIMDISLEIGFENLSYFNKLFKRKYNLTPKQFRILNNITIIH